MKKLFLIIIMMSFVAGCSLVPKNATPIDKAMIFSQQASQTYLTLYNTYNRLTHALTGKALVQLHTKVAPVLNQAKYALIRYNKSVISWKKSGMVDMKALYKDKATFYSIVDDAQRLLLLYAGKGVE